MKRLLILLIILSVMATCLMAGVFGAAPGNAIKRQRGHIAPYDRSVEVPILLFHHLADENTNSMTITPGHFEAVLQTLDQAGFHTITPEQLEEFVYGTADLPENPVMLTFDDGYESNALLAAPLLRKYGMCATVFAIGVSVGKDTYKETGIPIIPHFSWEQAREASDVIVIQSHTYDMHHTDKLDSENFRLGVLQRAEEDDDTYQKAFTEDFLRSKIEIESGVDQRVIAYAYPYGQYSKRTESMLKELGVRMTFLTDEGSNQIIRSDVDSLFSLKRKSVEPDTDMDDILKYVSTCL